MQIYTVVTLNRAFERTPLTNDVLFSECRKDLDNYDDIFRKKLWQRG